MLQKVTALNNGQINVEPKSQSVWAIALKTPVIWAPEQVFLQNIIW